MCKRHFGELGDGGGEETGSRRLGSCNALLYYLVSPSSSEKMRNRQKMHLPSSFHYEKSLLLGRFVFALDFCTLF